MKNQSTTSIVLNVIASIISILLLFASLGALSEFKVLEAILMLISAILLSPLSKLIFKKQKQTTVRLIRILTPIALVIISAVTSDAISNGSNEESKLSNADIEKEKMSQLKDSLNRVLEIKNLSVCQVNDDLSKLELQCIKDADKKYPNFDYPQHGDYTEVLIKKRTLKYRTEKKLDSLFFDKVMIFNIECSEKERLQRVKEARVQKRIREDKKEQIEDCFSNACGLTRNKIKDAMHNPRSFQYVDCKYLGADKNTFTLSYSFRGENSLGATVLQKVKVEVDIKKCSILSIE